MTKMNKDYIITNVSKILKQADLSSKDHIIAAVSGGPDSICMLHILHRLKTKFNYKLSVAHFNHQLRGRESKNDQYYVEIFSSMLGLKIFLGKADIYKEKIKRKLTTQETARILRYNFLFSLKKALKATYIATAHNLDDQAELVLLRIIRGSSTTGLSGMTTSSKNIIRPLITTSRKEILEYLAKESIPYTMDSSNLSTAYLRNQIRLELIPRLEAEFNPKIKYNLFRIAKYLKEDEEFISTFVEKVKKNTTINNTLEIKVLKNTPSSIRRRLFIEIFKEQGVNVARLSHKHIESFEKLILSKKRKIEITLPGDIIAVKNVNKVYFKRHPRVLKD